MCRMLWGAPTLRFHHCTLSFKNVSHKTNNTPNRKYSTFSLHASHLLAPKQKPTTTYYMYLLRQNMRNSQQIEKQYVNIHQTNNTSNIKYTTFSLHANPACSKTTTHHSSNVDTLFYNLRELRSRSPFSNPNVCPQREEGKLQTSCHSYKNYYDNLNDVN